ncbi:hypothetical protein GGU10DRAFT_364414 [Lentinula aff. detonsa]|uniref:Secreted protein n=1 Tax=Lentinula aff. detonsa TaxID=2804958 RepID=A0AA38L3S3_9AGAR|nr:hypothetical protein GGU10DRAFT_364414 [Lentinula aff. detonsa]
MIIKLSAVTILTVLCKLTYTSSSPVRTSDIEYVPRAHDPSPPFIEFGTRDEDEPAAPFIEFGARAENEPAEPFMEFGERDAVPTVDINSWVKA